jgi:hypothetical protein
MDYQVELSLVLKCADAELNVFERVSFLSWEGRVYNDEEHKDRAIKIV